MKPKINRETVEKLYDEGLTNKEIALKFNVSPAYISQIFPKNKGAEKYVLTLRGIVMLYRKKYIDKAKLAEILLKEIDDGLFDYIKE